MYFLLKMGIFQPSYISLPRRVKLLSPWVPQDVVSFSSAISAAEKSGGRWQVRTKKGADKDNRIPGNKRNLFPQKGILTKIILKRVDIVWGYAWFNKQQTRVQGRQGTKVTSTHDICMPFSTENVVPYHPGGHYYPVGFGQTNKPKAP